MDEGFLYMLVAFTIVWVVIGGYLAYMMRRERTAQQALKIGGDSAETQES